MPRQDNLIALEIGSRSECQIIPYDHFGSRVALDKVMRTWSPLEDGAPTYEIGETIFQNEPISLPRPHTIIGVFDKTDIRHLNALLAASKRTDKLLAELARSL